MARRTKTVTIQQEGRDRGKSFLITEMPADQAEQWAWKLFFALANGGTQIPEEVRNAGVAGLASMPHVAFMAIKSLAGLRYETARELLDEMMACVKFAPPGVPAQDLFPGENCQIEEVRTLFTLRMEVAELHLGFSLAGVASNTQPSRLDAEQPAV